MSAGIVVKSLSYDLRIDWATYEAAKYACTHWHYSKSIPVGKIVKVGAWEDDRFIGVVLFSRGANNHIGMPYGLEQTECCELTRVAMRPHKCFVSEVLAAAIKFLQKKCPDLKLIISYADIDQGHYGGIYQATNWIYEGRTVPARYFIVHGEKTHPKSLHAKYNDKYSDFAQSLEWIRKYVDKNAETYHDKGKHKYLFPLTKEMRKKVEPLRKPYPKKE